MSIHNRGFNFLVPIGRNLTQQEEKNDVCLSDAGLTYLTMQGL